MRKIKVLAIPLLMALFNATTYAVCPVCTVAVGAGLGISRWLGIDDSIAALWIGGLVLSMGLWLGDVIKKKWNFSNSHYISVPFMLLLVLGTLKVLYIIGLPGNTLYGIDKLVFGILLGLPVFWSGTYIDKWLRTKNNGKVFIYYQKVMLPVFMLTIGSLIMYLITSKGGNL